MAITINVNLDEILAALKDDLDFTGNADKYIKVNATADGFEFAAVSTSVSWGEILGLLSDQTDLQSALDLKANLAGASFTGDVSVTTSGSGDTLQLINSGSGTTLNITNSGSGDFFAIDTNKLVVSNNGNLAVDTNTLFVDATNNRVGVGTATPTSTLEVSGHAKILAPNSDNQLTIGRSVGFAGSVNLYSNSTYALFASVGANTQPFISFRSGNKFVINAINTNTPSAQLTIYSSSSSTIGQIIQAAAGQTANLQEWKDSAGNVLASVSGGGNLAVDTNTLFVDAVNNRVGIGTATPTYVVDMLQTPTQIGAISTTLSQTIGNSFFAGYDTGSIRRGFVFGVRSTGAGFIQNIDGASPYSFEMQPFGGGVIFGNASGAATATVSISRSVSGVNFYSKAWNTTDIPAIIQAAAGQTANLLEVKNSGGTNLFEITASGKVYLGNNTPHPNDATNIVTVNGIMSLSNGFIRIDGQNRVRISTSAWVWDTAITPVAKGFSGYANQDLTIRTGSTSYNLNLGLVSQTNLRIANTTGNVLIGTTTDVASSVLTAHSTTKGFLPPRMTGAQVEAISSPAEGLIAYATNAGSGDVTAAGAYLYNGSNWELMSLQTELDTKADKLITANRQTESYTLVIGDADKLVEMNVGSANNLTVPLNSSVAFPTGTQISLAQYGAGQTTIVATSGVTIRSAGGALKLAAQYSGATLVKIDTDEWYLFGDITT